jgi:hypothetical protein
LGGGEPEWRQRRMEEEHAAVRRTAVLFSFEKDVRKKWAHMSAPIFYVQTMRQIMMDRGAMWFV